MLVHVLRLDNDSLSVNGANILAFEAGIDWDVTRVEGRHGPACLPAVCFNIHLAAAPGLVALVSDGEPLRLGRLRGPRLSPTRSPRFAWVGRR